MANKRRVILVHGAGLWRGDPRLYRLADPLAEAGLDVTYYTYGFVFALTSLWRNRKAARELGPLLQPGDVVIGHSNGCLVADMAIQHAYSPLRLSLVCLSPALDSSHVFDKRWNRVVVVRSPGDYTSFAEYIPLHPWGAMMRDGILGRAIEPREKQMTVQDFTLDNGCYEHGKFLEDATFQREFSAWISAFH